jgi:hypothetical protein
MDELENIFRPSHNSSKLPMLIERLNILHETGSILVKVIYFVLLIIYFKYLIK